MFNLLLKFIATVALGFSLHGLAWAGTSIAVINPTFDSPDRWTAPGWTFGEIHGPGYKYTLGGGITPEVINSPQGLPSGVNGQIRFKCYKWCYPGDILGVTQQLNGLTYGKSYEVSFWAKGFKEIRRTGNDPFSYPDPDPVFVSLGSQTSGAVSVVKYGLHDGVDYQKRSVILKYLDRATSALFSIFETFDDVALPECNPCSQYLSYLLLTNVQVKEVATAPVLTVTKALSGTRVGDTDQFTVQIVQNSTTVVNSTTNSTTTGTSSTVNPGSGSTGPTTLVSGTQYKITEAPSGTTRLTQYNSTLTCTDSAGANKPLALNATFTLQDDEVVNCKITNTAKPVTLTVRQLVQSPVPINLVPPFKFTYDGTNGWGTRPITNAALNVFNTTTAIPLTAINTATTIRTALPEPRWTISSFSCTDLSAADSGNRTGTLISVRSTTLNVPASFVRAGANLRCTLLLGHLTP